MAEVNAPGERRYRYPFTNCTYYGPRYSILERMPYDRPQTSMKQFQMCADCEAEYRDPADRRFHAQPIACPACAPTLRLIDADGTRLAEGDAALLRAAEAVKGGQVLALKGIGGFQLLVDATSEDAVTRLRRRKQREGKPLALMMPSLELTRRHCETSDEEEQLLASPEAPILLLRRRPTEDAAPIVDAIAPGNP